MIMSRKKRWAGHVAWFGGEEKCIQILIRKCEVRRTR